MFDQELIPTPFDDPTPENSMFSAQSSSLSRLRPIPTRALTPEQRELELQTFSIAFEFVLESLAEGNTFERFCREYQAPIAPLSIARFRTWIFRDDRRKAAYLVAKAMGAEAVEDELIRISDGLDQLGNPAPSEVSRSKLQIDTRKWLLQVWNRKRYGDIKQVEQTVSTTTTIESVKAIPTHVLQQRLLQSLGLADLDDVGDLDEIADPDQDPS